MFLDVLRLVHRPTSTLFLRLNARTAANLRVWLTLRALDLFWGGFIEFSRRGTEGKYNESTIDYAMRITIDAARNFRGERGGIGGP